MLTLLNVKTVIGNKESETFKQFTLEKINIVIFRSTNEFVYVFSFFIFFIFHNYHVHI